MLVLINHKEEANNVILNSLRGEEWSGFAGERLIDNEDNHKNEAIDAKEKVSKASAFWIDGNFYGNDELFILEPRASLSYIFPSTNHRATHALRYTDHHECVHSITHHARDRAPLLVVS